MTDDMPTTTVGAMVVAAAESTPDADAIVTPGWRISYAELLTRAAHHSAMLCRDAGPGPVAVRQDGSVDAIAASFGTMLSGRALIAIDIGLPQDRIDHIVAAAGATTMRVDAGNESSPATVDVVDHAHPDDIAMICYTSGSTGEPKGVLLSHRTLMTKIGNVVDGQALRDTDRLGNLLPLGFSAGMNTVLAGIMSRATVLCGDPRDTDLRSMTAWLRTQQVSTLHTSVVLARQLGSAVRQGVIAPLNTVRQVAYYGEAATGADVAETRHITEATPRIVNWYAATEVGVIGYAEIEPGDEVPAGRIGAGRPLPGRIVSIVADDGTPITDGSVGEVAVTGGPIADGYLGRDSERFLADAGSGRGYRSGDRGRLDESGELHLAGRIDDAVKIRGYLVEPSEVETALYDLDDVTEAFVTATTVDDRIDLVAYVSGAVTDNDDIATAVRTALRTRLPEWMIPRFVVGLDALPRTERGKLDRSALPEPRLGRGRSLGKKKRASPDIVDAVATFAVTRAMGLEEVDPHQDLIALGANSLALAQVVSTVRQRINGDIDFAAFTTDPTIATLAASIRDHYRNGGGVQEGNGVLVPIRKADNTFDKHAPLFVVSGAGGPASSLMAMARRMTPGRAVYGLQALGLERTGRPDRSVAAMARRYVDLIRTVQPHGPYLLAGHSMGGIVACEISALLAEQGDETTHLIEIDTSLTDKLISDLDVPDADADDVYLVDDEPAVPYEPNVSVSKRHMLSLAVKLPLTGRVIFDPVTQWILFYRHGGALTNKHRLRRIAAPITVLAAPGTAHRWSWWRAVTSGPVHIRPVQGGHVELLHDPFVATVAEIVDDVLAGQLSSAPVADAT